jgi:hypothetical protein
VRQIIHKHFNERIRLIRQNKRLGKSKRHKARLEFPEDLEKIEDNLHKYFKQYPKLKCQTKEDIEEFLSRVEHFGLTLGEKIQFINLAPTTLVETHLLIEDCSARYKEEETLQLLEIVRETLLRNLVIPETQADNMEESVPESKDETSSSV